MGKLMKNGRSYSGWGSMVVPVRIAGTSALNITRSGDTITVSTPSATTTYVCGVFMTP